MSSNRKIDYRRPGVPDPAPPSRWRERGPIVAIGVLILCACIAVFAGHSAPIVFSALIIDGSLLTLWLLAAAGFAGFIPLPDNVLRPVTRIALGIGIIGTLQLLLGLAGGLHRASAFAMMTIGVVLLLVRYRRTTRGDITAWFTTPADWEWLWLLALPLLAMAIVAAYAPPGILWGDEPHGYDVLEYHLQLPREWYQLGRIVPLKHNVFSYFPLAVEMHYLLAMQLAGGPWAGMYLAQLMHVTMIVLAIVAIYATARQFAPKLPAMLAALSAAAVPWMLLLAPVAYNEGGLLLFGTLAMGWLIHSLTQAELASIGPAGEHIRTPASLHAWIVAGLFAGFACGVKLTGVPLVLLIVPLVVAAVAWRRKQPRVGRAFAAYLIAGVVVFSPWLLRNAIWAGNPVFPEAQNLLGRAHFSEQQAERWRRAHSPPSSQQSIAARLQAAKKQFILDWRYGYAIWFPAAYAIYACIRRPQARVFALLLIAWLIFWLGFTHLQGRFFVLAIPILAMAIALMEYKWQQWEMTVVAAVVAIQIMLGMYLSYGRFRDIVGPLARNGLLGFQDLKQMLTEESAAAIDRGDTIALIGDARAFIYPVPASRLFYKTVFDVDVKSGQSAVDAWAEGAPPSARRIIDRAELERFAKTYYGIPKPD